MATCCDRTQAEIARLTGEFADLLRAVYSAAPGQCNAIMSAYATLQAERRPRNGGYTHGKRKKKE
jgi:hypothetical protein